MEYLRSNVRERSAAQLRNARRRAARNRFRAAVRKVILLRTAFSNSKMLMIERALIPHSVSYDLTGQGLHWEQESPDSIPFGVYTLPNGNRMYRPLPSVAFHKVSLRHLVLFGLEVLGLVLLLLNPSLFVPAVRLALEILLQTKFESLSTSLMTSLAKSDGWKSVIVNVLSYVGGILKATSLLAMALGAYILIVWVLWRLVKSAPQKFHHKYFWTGSCPYCHFEMNFRLLFRFRCTHCNSFCRFESDLRLILPLEAYPLPRTNKGLLL